MFLVFILTANAFAGADSKFSDADLKQLLETKKTGVIYIWSPHMNYSDLGRRVIEKVCEDLGVPVTMLLDPNAVGEEGVRNNSRQLMELGAGLHFPGLHLFKDGVLLSDNLMGAKSYPDYKRYIATKLNLEVSNAQPDFDSVYSFSRNDEFGRLEEDSLDSCAESTELLLPSASE